MFAKMVTLFVFASARAASLLGKYEGLLATLPDAKACQQAVPGARLSQALFPLALACKL